MYQAEYERLTENLPLPNTSVILKMDPYYDKRDRLLQVRGRLQYSDLPEGMKHPIIVPHGHPVVKEIIQSVHKELLRTGPESTLSVLRQANWLAKRRGEVKRVLGKCLVCQRQRVRPPSQKMAPSPSERVSSSSAFAHVGIDFAESHLNKGLHLHFQLRLFWYDSSRVYQWLINRWFLPGVDSYDE